VSRDGGPVATPSQTVGPFFSFGLTTNPDLGRLARPDVPGDRLHLIVRVFDGDGTPVPDAMIELWHADNTERFLFGRLGTDADGTCAFETIRPPQKSREASHINVCLFMRGMLRHLYTRMYFVDDETLKEDATLALVPADRRETLIARPASDLPGAWLFDVRLQGERETVFFDL
jgi:protocatechuate 3,4-dioxygenase alpha subunit